MARWSPVWLLFIVACEPGTPWVPEFDVGVLRDVREIPNAALAEVINGADRPCVALFDPMPTAPLDPDVPAAFGWFCPVDETYVFDMTPLTPVRPGEPERAEPLLVRNTGDWGSFWVDWTPTASWRTTDMADRVLPGFTQPVELNPGQIKPMTFRIDDRPWRLKSGTFTFEAALSVSYLSWGQTEDDAQPIDPLNPNNRWIEHCGTPDGAPTGDECPPAIPFNVSFTVDCDRDDDGFEALACGGDDCQDEIPEIHPNADEICDRVDNNCDGEIDLDAIDKEAWYLDFDLDGYGRTSGIEYYCGRPIWPWYSDLDGDCDDSAFSINPSATELCGNSVDENCDDVSPPCEVPPTAP